MNIMLIECTECKLTVSDKAIACPHCGFPFRPEAIVIKKRKSSKKKKLPNGFGQISEIKGRYLRNPFRAMVTVGKTSTGRPICKPLKPQSFFPTYNDAYNALVNYNKNPYDLEPSITVKQLYDKWTESYFKTLKSKSSERTIKSSWAYCSSVEKMRASDIRARHIKSCMDEGVAMVNGEERKPTPGVKGRIKSMFNLMLDYALEYEIVDKNYARTFNVSDDIINETEESKRGHIPFTDEEMDLLWGNINIINYVDVVMIQCYTGFRPQELGLIRLENVNLDEHTIVGGMKTEAGQDRLVPIHSKIYNLIVAKYNEAVELGSEYLINCNDTRSTDKKMTYDKYKVRFEKIRDRIKLNPEHRAHDPRKHFVTMAKKYNLDEYAIKYIVGHSINDITERVYTQREVDWLKEEMKKIK